ncbi:MAG: hypothetical protein J6K85_03855 [Clostridia bacterium]|nr:hypothetical protein [Clostridia bacterium]
MLYLRWCGAALLLICALICGREYSAYIGRRVREGEGYLSLLSCIEKMIDSYLTPLSDIFSGFECEALEKSGFLPSVRSGRSASEALGEKSALIPENMRSLLSDYFDGFGKGYKNSELGRTREARVALEKMLDAEKENLEKSVRVTKALLLGGAVGIAILII